MFGDLKILMLSFNGMESLKGIEKLSKLEKLICSHNQIKETKELEVRRIENDVQKAV